MLGPTAATDATPRPSRLAWLILGVLLLAAAGIRFQGLGDPLVTFHPLRHYRSALIARACFYEATPATPEWALTIAQANRDIQQAGEPPVMEWMACAAYRALGHEDLRVPNILSGLCWLLAAVATFLLGRRLLSVAGGLLAAAICLFAPYAILATRTFQPDPLMTAATMWAVLGAVRWHDRPTPGRLVAVAALAGAALFIKPMSLFVILPALVVIIVAQQTSPNRRPVSELVWMTALTLVAPGLFYGSSMLFGSLAQDQFQTRFVPALLTTDFFWTGMTRQLGGVFGWPLVAAAIAGTLFAVQPLVRHLLAAIWIGYAAFAVAFTYHVPTHDYYHLPFIPVAALAAAAAVDRVRSALGATPATSLAVASALAVLLAWHGSVAASPRLRRPDAAALVADYRRIGDVTNHDGRIIFLDPEYGYPLMYHAEVAGDAWPGIGDLEAERLDGRPVRAAIDRFHDDYARPNYFVVTDLASLKAQPELVSLLASEGMLVEETTRFKIYKLTEQ